MIIKSINQAVSQIISKPFRAVLWKSVGLTAALFMGLWFSLEALATVFLYPLLGPWPWATTAIAWILGAGLILGMGFLMAPVTSFFAGIFLDEVAEAVEARHYPDDPKGTPIPLGQSILMAIKFFGLVLAANLVALMLVLFFGFGVLIFFVLNGYLLGREYFQFAALRHISTQQADALRQQFGVQIFLSGLAIAALLAVPLVNLLTPLFAAALMVHVFKKLQFRQSAT